MSDRIRVLIADDDPMILTGLQLNLDQYRDIELVGQIDNAGNTLTAIHKNKANVLIMDLMWFGDEHAGIEQIRRVRAENLAIKIIAITAYQHLLEDAKLAGAHIVRRKGFSAEELIQDIRAVVQFPDDMLKPLSKELSNRECEILKLMADGLTDKAIGYKLSIAEPTVKATSEAFTPNWTQKTGHTQFQLDINFT